MCSNDSAATHERCVDVAMSRWTAPRTAHCNVPGRPS